MECDKSDEPDVTDTDTTVLQPTLKEKLTSMTHLPKIVKVQALFLTMMTMLITTTPMTWLYWHGVIYFNATIGCSILTFYRLCQGDQTPVFDLLISIASFLSYIIYVVAG